MKALVTGGAGFIGSHLARALLEEDNRVRVLDNLSVGSLERLGRWVESERFEFVEGDMRSRGKCTRAVEGVDAVFHLAANPEVRMGSQSPVLLYETNALITHNLLEAMRGEGVEELAFTSSSTVYGSAEEFPTPEHYSPLEPISVYGGAKLAAEALISGYAHTFGIRSIVFRLANVVGKNSDHGVIYDFVNKLKASPGELEVLGDGSQRKSYLHVSDTVGGMLHLFERFRGEGKVYDIYNLGSEDWITVREIAGIVAGLMGLSPELRFTGGVEGGAGWKGDVKFMRLGIEKAESKGWKPEMGSSLAVERTARELLR